MKTVIGRVVEESGCESARICQCADVLVFEGMPSISADSLVVSGSQVAEGKSNKLGVYSIAATGESLYVAKRCNDGCAWVVEKASIIDQPIAAVEPNSFLNITGPDEITEGQTATYTLKVEEVDGTPVPLNQDIEVTLIYSGETENADFQGTRELTVTIPAGQSNITIDQVLLEDANIDTDEINTITIGAIVPAQQTTTPVIAGWQSAKTTIVRERLVETIFTSDRNGVLNLAIASLAGFKDPIWIDEEGNSTTGQSFSKTYSTADPKTISVWTEPNSVTQIYANNSNLLGLDIADGTKSTVFRIFGQSNPDYAEDVDKFSDLPNLVYLYFQNTDIGGDVSSLKDQLNLNVVNLGDSNVGGMIDPLASLSNLTSLNLGNTNVGGSANTLYNTMSLNFLSLADTSATGTIVGISNLVNLTVLSIYKTTIGGDASELSTMTNLEYIDISETNITGNTSSLAALTAVEFLNVSITSLVGFVDSFSAMTSLATLYVSVSSITGDADSLLPIPTLNRLSVVDTIVSGTITTWQARNMVQLDYNNSNFA